MAISNGFVFRREVANVPQLSRGLDATGDATDNAGATQPLSLADRSNAPLSETTGPGPYRHPCTLPCSTATTLAIAALMMSGRFIQCVAILQIPMEPTMIDLLASLVESKGSDHQQLVSMLKTMDKRMAMVSTAIVPLNKKEYMENDGDWTLSQ
ncbi:hypothetical protein APHAL10511_000881 [Amanita phalloides]|nr:hypothetical protein APHAL10511_000881 [Amanita phalloides]